MTKQIHATRRKPHFKVSILAFSAFVGLPVMAQSPDIGGTPSAVTSVSLTNGDDFLVKVHSYHYDADDELPGNFELYPDESLFLYLIVNEGAGDVNYVVAQNLYSISMPSVFAADLSVPGFDDADRKNPQNMLVSQAIAGEFRWSENDELPAGGWALVATRALTDTSAAVTGVAGDFYDGNLQIGSVLGPATDSGCPAGEDCPEPLALVSSTPDDGSIDARRATDILTGEPLGWSGITLTFDGDATTLELSDFVVNEIGGDGNAVALAALTVVNSTTIDLEFDASIEAGAWTEVTYLPGSAKVRLGFLPGDVDGNKLTAVTDVIKLIDALNGQVSLPDYATDIDRSSSSNAADIVALIDLLNGADGLGVWNGATLP